MQIFLNNKLFCGLIAFAFIATYGISSQKNAAITEKLYGCIGRLF
jgi:hypothetical protein